MKLMMLLVVAATAAPGVPAQPGVPVPPATPVMPVTIAFSGAATMGLPRGDASFSAHGDTIRCEGVWLHDLVVAAGLPAGAQLRGPAMAAGVIAQAADGYRVLFSAAELDPGLGGTRVLVADKCQGRTAGPNDTPRLVVPADRRAARSVRNLVRLTYLPDPVGRAVLP